MAGQRIDDNAILSALKAMPEVSKTLRFGRLVVYKGWKSEEYTRARANFERTDGSKVSFFLHIGSKNLKVWVDSSNKPEPNYTLEGLFHMI